MVGGRRDPTFELNLIRSNPRCHTDDAVDQALYSFAVHTYCHDITSFVGALNNIWTSLDRSQESECPQAPRRGMIREAFSSSAFSGVSVTSLQLRFVDNALGRTLTIQLEWVK